MKNLVCIICCLFVCLTVDAQYAVKSPNEKVNVTLSVKRAKRYGHLFRVPDRMKMNVVVNRRECIKDKEIGLTVLSEGRRIPFGRCEVQTVANQHAKTDDGDDAQLTAKGLIGKYNSLTLTTNEGITLQVRVYNGGVAYRFVTERFTNDYKILDVLKVFPDDVPIADLGTFGSDHMMPWCVYAVDGNRVADDGVASEPINTADQFKGYRRTKFVPWRDALTTIMIGVNGHKYDGGAWRDVALDVSPSISLTYKHLYTSVEFETCHQIMYINMGESYYPFCDATIPLDFLQYPETNVIGAIHAWNVGAHLGYRLPIQTGYTVWGITPYVGASLTHLTQHRDSKHLFAGNLSHHDHFAVGPGIMLQINLLGRIAFGINYDYQFYTDSKAPNGRHSLGINLGYQL